MHNSWLIYNATIVNEGKRFAGSLLVRNGIIQEIYQDKRPREIFPPGIEYMDAQGKLLIPGVIDDQVHFREPGLTHKADIFTESMAAVAGGITSFMEMPNTNPPAITQKLLEEKYELASHRSFANYSFYMGTSNDNVGEVLRTDARNVCGIKIFMGASTGNMLVDDPETLKEIFSKSRMLIATHCEDETTIRNNSAKYRELYGEDIPMHLHPEIRSREACLKSTQLALRLAREYNTRLHVLHLSTADEAWLFSNEIPLGSKRITAEVCVHHLWFDEAEYHRLGSRIKWNPAIKSASDREALLDALLSNRIDVIATDHAPHTSEEKNNPYFRCPSGAPMVQHALPAMLELWHQKKISLETIVEKMCHAPAVCFRLKNRGFLRPGYFADLVIVNPDDPLTVAKESLFYKCGWSPMEGVTFHSQVTHTFVNGKLVFENGRHNFTPGMRLEFDALQFVSGDSTNH